MKICIIGDGLTALILAKNVTNKNIKVDLYSKSKSRKFFTTRTVGITEENLKFLETDFSKITKLGNKIEEINIYTNREIKKKILSFYEKDKYQFSVFEYNKLYNFLINNLKKNNFFKKINFRKNNKIYSTKFFQSYDCIVDTEIDNKKIKYKFNKKITKDYLSRAFVTTLNHNSIKNNIAVQIFTDYGPLAFLPINNRKTSIVFSIFNKAEVDKEKFKKLLFSYNTKYKIINFKKIETFDLKLSLLRKYVYKNVLAFGEKIHQIHPLAGQGLNMSIRDIKILSKLIDGRIKLGYPIDKFLLEEFEDKARHKNTIFANGINIINEFFNIEKKIPHQISQRFFKTFASAKFIKRIGISIANKGI